MKKKALVQPGILRKVQSENLTPVPTSVKQAVILIVLSCVSTLFGWYLDSFEYPDLSLADPVNLGVNLIWVAIIIWIIWDVTRKKQVVTTLVIVSLIVFVALIFDYMESGFSVTFVFYLFELVFFLAAIFLLRTEDSRRWFASDIT